MPIPEKYPVYSITPNQTIEEIEFDKVVLLHGTIPEINVKNEGINPQEVGELAILTDAGGIQTPLPLNSLYNRMSATQGFVTLSYGPLSALPIQAINLQRTTPMTTPNVEDDFTGYSSNILGGNLNTLSGSYGSIVGGRCNRVISTSSDVEYSVILGGSTNTIDSGLNGDRVLTSVILNGCCNRITDVEGVGPSAALIGTGCQNTISSTTYGSILNGCHNTIFCNTTYGSILNGTRNTIGESNGSTILGGNFSTIYRTTCGSILNGNQNIIFCTAYGSILNGCLNKISSIACGSTILNGMRNTIDGSNRSTIHSGDLNTISSTIYGSILNGCQNIICNALCGSILNGLRNTISNSFQSAILNGDFNTVYVSSDTTMIGVSGHAGDPWQGVNVYSMGQFNHPAGASQRMEFNISNQSTSTTPVTLFGGRQGASGNFLYIPIRTSWAFRAHIVAREAITGDTSAWEFTGVIKKMDDSASTTFVGSPIKTVLGQDNINTDADVIANTTNGSLQFTFTGIDSESYRVMGNVWITQLRQA